MACMVAVYKEGFSHVINGIQCEVLRIDVADLDYYLGQGYVKSIGDLAKRNQKESAPDPELEEFKKLKALREKAKSLGVKYASKMSEEKLIAEIEAAENGATD